VAKVREEVKIQEDNVVLFSGFLFLFMVLARLDILWLLSKIIIESKTAMEE
jgi:hypothetical protein